jgi:hypothetical protein
MVELGLIRAREPGAASGGDADTPTEDRIV